ncbi:MAG: tryptophan synthase subunit alpha [Candidatus Methanomethylophilaceae archaeon]
MNESFGNRKAIVPYIVVGDPDADSTVRYILALEKAGADMVEIGIPFSDPIADEPAQKDAALRGIASGANLDTAFSVLERVREGSDVPISIVSYLNPIFEYGYDRFFGRCADASVSAVFIIDMPYEERTEVSSFAKGKGIPLVTAVYPASEMRMALLADKAEGFIYLVPMDSDPGEVDRMVSFLKGRTDVPVLVAFGSGRPEDAVSRIGSADGLVIGSGVVEVIGGNGTEPEISAYVSGIRKAL